MGERHVEHEERNEEVADTTGDVKSTQTLHLHTACKCKVGDIWKMFTFEGVYGERIHVEVRHGRQ